MCWIKIWFWSCVWRRYWFWHCKWAVVQQGEPVLLSEDGPENLQLRDSVLVDSNVDEFIKPEGDRKVHKRLRSVSLMFWWTDSEVHEGAVCDLWPAGPQQWLVQQIWTVRGSDHKNSNSRAESVELGEQLRHDSVHRFRQDTMKTQKSQVIQNQNQNQNQPLTGPSHLPSLHCAPCWAPESPARQRRRHREQPSELCRTLTTHSPTIRTTELMLTHILVLTEVLIKPSLMFCSLWPTYMLMSSGPLTLKHRQQVQLWSHRTGTREKNCCPGDRTTDWTVQSEHSDQWCMKVFLPEEGHGALGRHSFGEQSLSCSWWSVQQDSGPVQTQRQEFWTLQRKLDRVQDLLLHLLQPSDIVPAHIRDLFTGVTALHL